MIAFAVKRDAQFTGTVALRLPFVQISCDPFPERKKL